MSHTFVLATLNHEEVKFSEDGGSIQFKSSHQLFWNLLEEHSGSPTETVEIDVDVWTCSAFLDSGDNNALKTNPDSLQCTFKISSKRALKNKPVVVKLPFSLDKRYRKTRKVQEHGPQRKKKKSLKNMGKFKKPQAKRMTLALLSLAQVQVIRNPTVPLLKRSKTLWTWLKLRRNRPFPCPMW